MPTRRTTSSARSLARTGLVFAGLGGLVAACGPTPPEPFDCDQSGAVCTAVGTGAYGFNGDGLDGRETFLYFPTAVTVTSDGDPIFADFNNMRIRGFDADGAVFTLAGSGYHSFAAPGPALDSPLENPVDVAADDTGGFFIAELHAARVLHVDAAGQLSVVAGSGTIANFGDGGPALDATFSELNGIAVGNGRVYIADTDNHRIRAYDPQTDTVLAVAGTGEPGWADGPADQAQFNGPQHLTWTDAGLLVADRWNHAVRLVDVDAQTVQTLAGTGTPGSTGDDGPATEAQLNEPHGVAQAPDGTVWIADTENHRVARIRPDGTFETVVGTGKPEHTFDEALAADVALYRPQNVTVDPDGRVWISDTLNSRIRVWVP